MGFVVGLLVVINLCFAVAVIHKSQDLNAQIRRSSWLQSDLQEATRKYNECDKKRLVCSDWLSNVESTAEKLAVENADLRKKLLQEQRAVAQAEANNCKIRAENIRLSEDLDTEKRVNADHQEQIVDRDCKLVSLREFYKAVHTATRNYAGSKV